MKHLYLNLKRFDVPAELGGVNSLAPIKDWGAYIVENTQRALAAYAPREADFVQFYPEAHILSAAAARLPGSAVKIGAQGVYRADVAVGGAFGAFTTNMPAAAASALGCQAVIIGHCEERADKKDVLSRGGCKDFSCVNDMLCEEIKLAIGRGMSVLYCVGENSEEQERWREVLGEQLKRGLSGVDTSKVIIAYEPIWSIGPGKTPADAPYITKAAQFIKEVAGGVDVIYGGGLKKDNAAMLAGIAEIDGGLIALTRFAGQIGFYPEEYIEIIRAYMGH